MCELWSYTAVELFTAKGKRTWLFVRLWKCKTCKSVVCTSSILLCWAWVIWTLSHWTCSVKLLSSNTWLPLYSFRYSHDYLSPTSAVFFLTFAYEWPSKCKLSVCLVTLRGEGTLEKTKNPGDAGKIGVGLPLCWNDHLDSKGWGYWCRWKQTTFG